MYRAIESAVDAVAALADDVRPSAPVPRAAGAGRAGPAAGYAHARAAFAAAGVPFAAARIVSTREGAAAAAAELGYPVVLKALGALHKSDAGGVVLGLADEVALMSGGRSP